MATLATAMTISLNPCILLSFDEMTRTFLFDLYTLVSFTYPLPTRSLFISMDREAWRLFFPPPFDPRSPPQPRYERRVTIVRLFLNDRKNNNNNKNNTRTAKETFYRTKGNATRACDLKGRDVPFSRSPFDLFIFYFFLFPLNSSVNERGRDARARVKRRSSDD